MKKRILPLLMALLMCLTLLPTAYAAPAEEPAKGGSAAAEEAATQPDAAAPEAAAPVPDTAEAAPGGEPLTASVAQSGSCGTNATWTLYDNGELKITGSGAIMDYPEDYPTFYDYKDEITSIVVSQGITSIGTWVFYNLTRVKTAVIEDSVTSIGYKAFQACSSLTRVVLPTSLTTIGDSCFSGCTNLRSLVLPSRVTSLGSQSLSNCSQLKAVVFTGSVPAMSEDTLDNDSLTVYYPTANSTWTAAVRAETYGASSITWDYTKTGTVGRVEVTGVKPVTGAIPNNNVSLVTVNSGVEIVSAEWRNGRTNPPAQVFQGGSYPYLYVTLRAFDGCTLSSGSTYINFVDADNNGCSYSKIESGKTGTFYCFLYSLPKSLDYTIDLSRNGTDTITGEGLVTAILRDLPGSASSATTSGTVTALDFDGDGNTDVTMDNQSSGSTYKLVFTQKPGLLKLLAKKNKDQWEISNPESSQLTSIHLGQTFYQSLTIYPKCATLTLVGNGGRFIDGSTTLKLTLAGSGRIQSRDLDEYGLEDFLTAGFRSGYLPLRLAKDKNGSEPLELSDLYYAAFTQDTTLYMLWGKPVKLTINGNGGKFYSRGMSGLTNIGTSLTMTVPAGYQMNVGYMDHTIIRNGYLLQGLSTDKAGTKPVTVDSEGYVKISANTTLYAQWAKPDTPVIVVDPNSARQHSAITHDTDLAVGETLHLVCYVAGKNLSLQWQLSTDGGTTWVNSTATGAKTSNLSVTATLARDGYLYRCVVTDGSGHTATSSSVQLDCYIGILIPVANAYGAVGDTAKFTVKTSGATAYQWQLSTNDGASWANSTATGAKTDTLSVPITAARDGYLYRCVITFGDYYTDTSDPGELVVTNKLLDQVDLNIGTFYDGMDREAMAERIVGSAVGTNFRVFPEALMLIPDYAKPILDKLSLDELEMFMEGSYYCQSLVPGEYMMVLAVTGRDVDDTNPFDYLSTPGAGAVTESFPGLSGLLSRSASEAEANASAGSAPKRKSIGPGFGYDPRNRYHLNWDKLNITCNGKTLQKNVDWLHYEGPYMGNETAIVILRFTVKDETARIVTNPHDVAGPAGETAWFTVGAAGTALAYQWQISTDNGKTWVNSTAASCRTNSLEVSITSGRNGYLYRCVVTDYKGNTATSGTAKLTVSDKPIILTQPKSVTANVGTTVKFTVDAAALRPTYQWQIKTPTATSWVNSTALTAQTATLEVPATAGRDGYQYRCVITNESGGKVTSNAAKLTVNTIIITTQPKSVTARVGETVNFTVKATGTGLKYQWQIKTSSTAAWTNSTAASGKTATLSVPVTDGRDGYQYRCVITDSKGKTATTGTAKLTVTTINITTQPKAASAAVGDTTAFTVKATGTGLKYQWQIKTSSTASWVNSTAASGKTASLSVAVTAAKNGYQYRCVITDAKGSQVISGAAKLTVKTTITAQPKAVSGKIGDTVNVSVTATGAGLSYQWQIKTSSTASWVNSTAASGKTATLSVTVTAAKNGYQYRCVITDANGAKTTSSAAKLTVKPAITAQPKSVSVTAGSTTSFKVTATGVGLTYQWQIKTSSTASWVNSTAASGKTATLSVSATAAKNGYQYRCVITDANGLKVTSSAATLTVK